MIDALNSNRQRGMQRLSTCCAFLTGWLLCYLPFQSRWLRVVGAGAAQLTLTSLLVMPTSFFLDLGCSFIVKAILVSGCGGFATLGAMMGSPFFFALVGMELMACDEVQYYTYFSCWFVYLPDRLGFFMCERVTAEPSPFSASFGDPFGYPWDPPGAPQSDGKTQEINHTSDKFLTFIYPSGIVIYLSK